MPKRVVVTGATGLIGRALLTEIEQPVVLSRSASPGGLPARCQVHRWASDREAAPGVAFEDADAIVHMAGEPVADGRWTADKKARIRDSRVLGTRNLVAALAQLPVRPKVLVSASAVGFYGDRADTLLAEDAQAGEDFLADVCKAWEAEALMAKALGMRVVCVRTGLVLAREGGALPRMALPAKLGLGGQLGDGQQWMPWIHIDDHIAILRHALRDADLHGPVNAVAPSPVKNRDFAQVLADTLHRPNLLAAPAWALKLALGETSKVVLASQRALPQRMQDAGFKFRYPELEQALAALFGRQAEAA